MPPTRGKKRSSRDTQKQNVNDPREGATRVVTVASGHQKGQKKMQKLQHTPGGANLAWANEPCTTCTGSRRCANCKDQMKKAISKARQKGKKAAAAAAAAEEEEEQEEKGELERRAETLEIGTPGERAKLRSHDLKARRRAQKLISQVRDCALARLLCSSSLVTVSPPPSLAIQAIARAGEKLLEQGFETKDGSSFCVRVLSESRGGMRECRSSLQGRGSFLRRQRGVRQEGGPRESSPLL